MNSEIVPLHGPNDGARGGHMPYLEQVLGGSRKGRGLPVLMRAHGAASLAVEHVSIAKLLESAPRTFINR